MQNQTNPKPSGALMAKLVLILCVIISLGLALGVAGYWAKNKPVKNSEPPVSPAAEPSAPAKDQTANWKTYKNEEYGFEVKYPVDLVLKKNTGEAYISFEGKLAEKSYFLQFGYVSQSALSTIGISYCGAHLRDDSRCENFTFNNLQFLIDWNIEEEGAFTQSRAEIKKSEGGMIIISMLHSSNQDIKLFFRQILSTFKFTK